MKKLISILLSVTAAISAFPVNAAAESVKVEVPTASIESGTYWVGELKGEKCNHSKENPGYHYYYDKIGYANIDYWCNYYIEEANACKAKGNMDGYKYNQSVITALKNKTAVRYEKICIGEDYNDIPANVCSDVYDNYYGYGQLIFSCETKGADIYYDVEYSGINPCYEKNGRVIKGIKYSVPITISSDVKITAYAVKNGVKSESVTYSYKIKDKVELSHDSGTYDKPISVEVSCGGSVYYTTDGSKPTEKSKTPVSRAGVLLNHSYIDITESCTLRIYYTPSSNSGREPYYITKKYVIKNSMEPINYDVGILYDYDEKYYYNQLTAKQKKAYLALCEQAESDNPSSFIENHGLTNAELGEVRDAFLNENPQYLFRILNFPDTLQPKHDLSELQKAAEKIIGKVKYLETDYDKIKYLHDEVAKAVTYDMGTAYHQTAYGALVNGKAVCRGYANAFAYLCQAAGIECVLINGSATNSSGETDLHSWNMVKLDEKWYHVDVCWDDTKNGYHHNYFLISTAEISKNHTVDMKIDIPAAKESYDRSEMFTGKSKVTDSSVIDTVLAPCYPDIAVGTKLKLSYLFSRTDGVTFSVSDRSVAEIVKTTSGDYYVKGIGEGEAVITAKYKNEAAKLSISVFDVKDKSSKFTISCEKTVSVGDKIEITANIDEVTDEYVTWFLPDDISLEIIRVAGENSRRLTVKAVKSGTVKLYAMTSTGEMKPVIIVIE